MLLPQVSYPVVHQMEVRYTDVIEALEEKSADHQSDHNSS